MKKAIHPEYIPCLISCACGATVTTLSTKKSYKVDICSSCHPFYTGEQKIIDTEGRVERFQKRYGLNK